LTASANHLKLWTQLSLLPKLEISSSLSLNHLSIRIHRNTYSNASLSRPRGWNLDVVDIIPPESVLCAEFQRLRINLDFNKITPQPSRRFGGDETLASRPSLERPKSPPKSPKSLGEIEWPHNKPADHPKRTNKFQHHSNDVHQNLTAWYNSHVEWPYPTNSEKEELQLQNGLSRSTFSIHIRVELASLLTTTWCSGYLEEWFIKARRRRGAPIYQTRRDTATKTSEAILSHSLAGIETPEQFENSSNVGLLTPPSSMTVATLPAPSINKLASSALHILICGLPCHDQSNITVIGPTPKTPLSKLAPSIFSPGYIQSVAHHSKLVPTIAHAIMNRNWNSPELRSKLAGLSRQNPSDLHEDGLGETAQSRLHSIIQRRIWAMMQRKLFDPTAAGKLRWESPSSRSTEEPRVEVDEDLLGGGKENDTDSGMMIGEDEFNEYEFPDVDTEDSFQNVLADASFLSDDGMLLTATEHQTMWDTEEMLFGDGEREIDLFSDDEDESMIFGSE
jgi:hypothetical protein